MEFRLLPGDGIGRLVEPSDASQLTYNLAPATYEQVEMSKVALREAAAELKEFWSQHTVGEANGNLFKVAKGIGSTNWHQHDDQDEVFIVLRGQITVQLRTGDVELSEGDLFIVPRGVEHCPQADSEVHLLFVGPEITSTPEGGKPDWSFTSQTPPDATQ